MRKREIKNYFKFGILLAGILTILVNCDKDNFDDTSSFEEPSKPVNIANFVSYNEIPHIIDAVTELTGEKALKSTINFKTNKNRNAHIDINKVLKVKNKKGFINYTFRISVENNPSNVFYNMIVREEVDKKVKKPFIYKYTIDQDALPAFVASGNDMRYFKGMRYLLSYNKFIKEGKTTNREPDQLETILEEDCPNIENYGIPIVPQSIPTSSGGGGGSIDPYYQYGGGYIYPSTYNPYPTYSDPYTTSNDPVTGVYGTYSPTSPITSGGVDPQLNSGYPTIYNDYGGSSSGYDMYIYTFTSEWYGTGMDSGGSTSGSSGGSSSCTIIMIAFSSDIFLITIGNCNNMVYTQRSALIDSDCPDPQGTIGVLPPDEPCPPGYIKNKYNLCVKPCNTTLADLQKVFPKTNITRLQEIADFINKHGKDFGIDTKEKLQHFLAQAGHESKRWDGVELEAFQENLNFRVDSLGKKEYWEKYFNPISNPTQNINKANPESFRSSSKPNFVDVVKFANYVYNRKDLGNNNYGDGYKYRGRGLIQLTGKYNYTEFTNFYQKNYDNTVNFTQNPDLISSNSELAVISALWYFKINVLNKLKPPMSETTSVKSVTRLINSGLKHLEERILIFTKSKININCH
ncbi:MAG: hypothetical protein NDI80_01655 [Flavobacteriaceae bacterium]|nr:hypothetical protein [Flavobacteriaceae bacterium]